MREDATLVRRAAANACATPRRGAGHVVGLGSTHAAPAACGGGRQRGKHLVTLAVFLTSVTLERASNNKVRHPLTAI